MSHLAGNRLPEGNNHVWFIHQYPLSAITAPNATPQQLYIFDRSRVNNKKNLISEAYILALINHPFFYLQPLNNHIYFLLT